jgi:hypothetical protein
MPPHPAFTPPYTPTSNLTHTATPSRTNLPEQPSLISQQLLSKSVTRSHSNQNAHLFYFSPRSLAARSSGRGETSCRSQPLTTTIAINTMPLLLPPHLDLRNKVTGALIERYRNQKSTAYLALQFWRKSGAMLGLWTSVDLGKMGEMSVRETL